MGNAAVAKGSSPLVRGGQVARVRPASLPGLIPARAGRTDTLHIALHAHGAHPRSCGADVVLTDTLKSTEGSSPLVRGGHLAHGCHEVSVRLIPARAGRTPDGRVPPSSVPAHPRSCGADPQHAHWAWTSRGSSPLVRGGLSGQAAGLGHLRLIPARAGRTGCGRPCWADPTAHPRSCGADIPDKGFPQWRHGSSPLVRGGHRRESAADTTTGLIPARAGRTSHAKLGASRHPAHPRSCGADSHARSSWRARSGSSPLVRGGPTRVLIRLADLWLIPARAGRTTPEVERSAPQPAHPRSCGADPARTSRARSPTGSSPLVRGGLVVASAVVTTPGLIPARAGRTRAPTRAR